jgi:hypothetical protein
MTRGMNPSNKLASRPPLKTDWDTPQARQQMEQTTALYLRLLTNELLEQALRHRYSADGD